MREEEEREETFTYIKKELLSLLTISPNISFLPTSQGPTHTTSVACFGHLPFGDRSQLPIPFAGNISRARLGLTKAEDDLLDVSQNYCQPN